MGTGGSPTQSRDRNTRQVPDIRTHEGIQNFDPVGWQRALERLQAQEQINTPLTQFDENMNAYLESQQPQNINFNQLAQQQAPQGYVRSDIDLNQLLGQQGQQEYNTPTQPTYRQQSYNAPQQNYPVQQFPQRYEAPQQPVTQPIQRQGGVVRSGNNNFNSAVKLVLRDEGGYVDYGNRYGGQTNFGIIKDTFDEAKRRGLTKAPDVRHLTKDDAIRIYNKMFWQQSRAPQLPDALGSIYFDAYIQSPKGGPEILQRAINRVAGRNLVKVDGRIGPQTINAANSLINNNDDLRRLINAFCDERDARFRRVNAGSDILPGLLNRVKNTRKWALGQVGVSVPAQPQQRPQSPAPQVTPEPDNNSIDFSQDYLQNVPPAQTHGIYPNYADYINSPEYYQEQRQRWGGVNY